MAVGAWTWPISRTAPAKVNLVLEVRGIRPDGYHELRSVLAPLAFSDEILARPGSRRHPRALPDTAPDRLVVRGLATGPPEENLVLRALALLRGATGRALPALDLELRKAIPVAAGLGGGSSDAEAALELAAHAWGIRVGNRRLRRLAASIGSDVPFFVLHGWGLARGRGEWLQPLPPPTKGALGVLLFTPDIRLSTRLVFDTLDRARSGAPPPDLRRLPSAAGRVAQRLRAGIPAAELAELTPANDLWGPASELVPGLGQLRATLETLLSRPVHMSGSGPTLFVLYANPEGARRAARLVESALEGSDRFATGATRPAVIATHTLGGS